LAGRKWRKKEGVWTDRPAAPVDAGEHDQAVEELHQLGEIGDRHALIGAVEAFQVGRADAGWREAGDVSITVATAITIAPVSSPAAQSRASLPPAAVP
jgi:hypothetical protein